MAHTGDHRRRGHVTLISLLRRTNQQMVNEITERLEASRVPRLAAELPPDLREPRPRGDPPHRARGPGRIDPPIRRRGRRRARTAWLRRADPRPHRPPGPTGRPHRSRPSARAGGDRAHRRDRGRMDHPLARRRPTRRRSQGTGGRPRRHASWAAAQDAGLIRDRLPAVADAGRDRVDRELDAALDQRVAVAGAVAAEQFDLHHVERVEVREAVADAACQRRVVDERVR